MFNYKEKIKIFRGGFLCLVLIAYTTYYRGAKPTYTPLDLAICKVNGRENSQN